MLAKFTLSCFVHYWFCRYSDDSVQMWTNASAVRVHTSVKIPSEVSDVDVSMATNYRTMACHVLQLLVCCGLISSKIVDTWKTNLRVLVY